MIRSQTEMGGVADKKEPTEGEYSPTTGDRWGLETRPYRQPLRWGEPAIHETVDAQIASLKDHVEGSMKLVKAELDGQVELLRRDIKDLQGKKKQKEEKGWNHKMMLLQELIALVTTGIGILIGTLLVK